MNKLNPSNLALVTALVVAPAAHASYYQTNCANADASTRMNNGHSDNTLSVTREAWGDEGPTRTVIKLDPDEVKVEMLDANVLFSEVHDSCAENPGRGSGFWSRREVKTYRLRLTKEDGSRFDEQILGAKADGSIESFLICEENWSGIVPSCR